MRQLIFLLALSLLLGCTSQTMEENHTAAPADDAMESDDPMAGDAMESDDMVVSDSMEEPDSPAESMEVPMYSGEIYAGTTSKYLRYNEADYNTALSEGKTIYLYFYATWCPVCNAERPDILAAFEQLDDPDVVGFQVHYNDDLTNAEDEALARQYGVVYQHTTIIIGSDGTESFRSLSPLSTSEIVSRLGG